MCFPVIAVERYFSISHPFEKEKHLRRVTYLNSESKISLISNLRCNGLFSVACWIIGGSIAGLTAFFYPITNVSIYCNETPLRPADVKPLYRRTIYLTIPIGFASLLFTSELYLKEAIGHRSNQDYTSVICYGLIVYRVRRKWQKSTAAAAAAAASLGALGRYRGSKRHSSPVLATDAFVAASAILSQAALMDPTMSEVLAEEDEAGPSHERPSSIRIKGSESEIEGVLPCL